jgi:hypothetical protein
MERLLIGEAAAKVGSSSVECIDTHRVNVRAWIRRSLRVNAARAIARCLGEMCLANKSDDRVCAMVQLTF